MIVTTKQYHRMVSKRLIHRPELQMVEEGLLRLVLL